MCEISNTEDILTAEWTMQKKQLMSTQEQKPPKRKTLKEKKK